VAAIVSDRKTATENPSLNDTEKPRPPGGAPPDSPGPESGSTEDPEQGFMRELAQFFVVPSLIVLLCVGVFLMFGLLSSEKKSAREFLQEVRTSRGGDRWQAAFELSRALSTQKGADADPRLVADVLDVMRNEAKEDPKVRKYLLIALEYLGDKEAGPVIIDSLEDPDADVRLHAARALASLQSVPGAAGPLIKLLADDDAGIRKVAIFALGQTRDRAAVPALLPLLADPSEEIRWNSALALAVLEDPSGLGVLTQMIDRSHLDSIPGITEDQKTSAMINGIQGIYLLKDRSSIPRLRDLSEKDPSLKVRELALKTLEALEAP